MTIGEYEFKDTPMRIITNNQAKRRRDLTFMS